MKTTLAYALVLAFSGITSAQPVCFTICPTHAVAGDEITMTGYDENGVFFDLSTLDVFESNFHGIGDPYYSLLKVGDDLTNIDVVDGRVVFELIEDMLSEDVEAWDFFCVAGGEDTAFRIAGGDGPFETVAEAIAAGGTCEGQSCAAAPLPNPIIITPNVMTVHEEGETEGNFGVSLRNQPPSGCTITITVDPHDGGPSGDIILIGGSDPNGSIDLTFNSGNWNVPQTVVFKAIDDDIAEPNDRPRLSEEHTIHLVSSYPGHPTDANFVGENSVIATVFENDFPDGEILYNGIELPYPWPPDYGAISRDPMPVPYLKHPPDIIPIDVGRQLFVDDFLIESTTMTQNYHQATYYTAGNPVLTPTTVEEHGPEGNMMAGPFSGGAWYDAADSLFKMWYRGGMSGTHAIQSQLHATSTDGKNWDRPKLDVNPVGLLENFTCTPSNPSAGQQVTIAAFDANHQQVDLGDYDSVEFCFGWGGVICLSTGSGITIDANGGAVFTCTQAILDTLPYHENVDFLAEKTSSPSETEHFLLPFPFDPVSRAGNSVYPFSEDDAAYRDSVSILIDYNAPPSERYKWFATEFPGGGTQLTYRNSPDGIHWSAPQKTKEIFGDRTTVFYNPFRDVWVCSQRSENQDGNNRSYVEGTSAEDLISNVQFNDGRKVTLPGVHWVGGDSLDPRHTDPRFSHFDPWLYTLDAMPYESIMLGQFSIWNGPDYAGSDRHWVPKRCDILLGFSRDGFHWDRPDRTRFISCTWDEQSWRMGNVQSVVGSPLVVGDELYFYFNARPKPAPGAPDWDGDYQAGLAILRRDGFASMDASGSTKTLTTRPVQFTGKYLYVNTDSPAGSLKVEVLNTSDEVISPFTLASCDTISEDTTRKRVTWGANDDLSALAGTPVKFRFTLTDGSLYAFWVSPDGSGASYGYVGGGGPGFTGPRDTVGDVKEK